MCIKGFDFFNDEGELQTCSCSRHHFALSPFSDLCMPEIKKKKKIKQFMSSTRNIHEPFAKFIKTKEINSGIQHLVIKEQCLISNKENMK